MNLLVVVFRFHFFLFVVAVSDELQSLDLRYHLLTKSALIIVKLSYLLLNIAFQLYVISIFKHTVHRFV